MSEKNALCQELLPLSNLRNSLILFSLRVKYISLLDLLVVIPSTPGVQ